MIEHEFYGLDTDFKSFIKIKNPSYPCLIRKIRVP
jgi:hypothetical protein